MLKHLLFFMVLFLFFNPLWSQDVNLMSYNIRYDDTSDSINNWHLRKSEVLKIIKESKAGVIGIQEALYHQLKYLDKSMEDFEYVGVGRYDGKKDGEFAAILYDTTLYKMKKTQTFWLSQTPDMPSIGWDAALDRICTVVLLQDKESQKYFWVLNTHFDHLGFQAREKSAKLILKKIRHLNPDQLPLILMGDFNVDSSKKPYKIITRLLDDSRVCATEIKGANWGTFNGFKKEKEFEHSIIDFIFTNNLNVYYYTQINDQMPNKNFPSDHFPVFVKLELVKR